MIRHKNFDHKYQIGVKTKEVIFSYHANFSQKITITEFLPTKLTFNQKEGNIFCIINY